ncbi:MAG: hypothetical protein ABJF88_19340 [Rhodothermales bacterium]
MRFLLSVLLVAVAVPALAQVPDPVMPPDSLWRGPGEGERVDEPIPKELTFIGYSFTRTTASNVTPSNDLLQGQVIGRLFGPNSTRTVDQIANYTEQRFVPYFVYRPKILDGYATFRGLFKIDYTWGDVAYGVGNNRGGAINAGQINLQTLMANVDIRPSARYNVVVGLQRMFDGARDPNVNTLQSFQQSGYKLAYWGTQAVGISAYANVTPATRARVGVFQLWENLVAGDDDVILGMIDVEHLLAPGLEVGIDVWGVSDRAKGRGGISILGQGLNSLLAAYNGTTRLVLPQDYTAALGWAGARASYNREFAVGPWWADAFVMTNFGSIERPEQDAVSVFGVAANARVAYQYGRTGGDHVAVEALYTTGDADGAADGTVNSVITGNTYGSPVGVYVSGRSLLLFPDAQVVNRYYSLVHDIANQGLGVTGLFANVSRDLVPNKLTAKLGAATAFAGEAPAGGGRYMGTEVNAELTYDLKVFLTLGLHAAYVGLGDFYDAPSAVYEAPGSEPFDVKPDDPWAVFVTLSWLMF